MSTWAQQRRNELNILSAYGDMLTLKRARNTPVPKAPAEEKYWKASPEKVLTPAKLSSIILVTPTIRRMLTQRSWKSNDFIASERD